MKARDKKVIDGYLKKTKWLGILLQWVPHLRCIILNGSLASGTAKKSSDIDILVVAKYGRIYTVRFFINSFATLLGIKRSYDDNKSHAGKFCFNYYLSTNFLIIPINRGRKIDQYCADNYSKSVLVWGKQSLYNRFMEENEELFRKAGSKEQGARNSLRFPTNIFYPIFTIGRILEFLLNGWWGNRLENMLKNYQIRKIEKDERTKKYPDYIVYNDRELRFHPPKTG